MMHFFSVEQHRNASFNVLCYTGLWMLFGLWYYLVVWKAVSCLWRIGVLWLHDEYYTMDGLRFELFAVILQFFL